MDKTSETHATSLPARFVKLWVDLLRELAPKVLFFFFSFLLIFTLFKMLVIQSSVEFSAFAKAAVGALVLGKVVALLDWAESGYRFENYRRVAVILAKTIVYALVVLTFVTGERILEAFRRERSFSAAIDFMIENASFHRSFGLVLLISTVVGVYLTMQEIDKAVGEGMLLKFLLGRPADEQRTV